MFVGVTSGTRIRLLEDYIGAPAWNRPELAAELTGGGLGAFDLAHPGRSVGGNCVLLVVFAFLALAARAYLRRSNMSWLLANLQPPRATEEAGPAVTNR